MEPDEFEARMQAFSSAIAAMHEHNQRFDLGEAITNAFLAIADPDAERLSFEDERDLDFAITAMEVQAALQDVGIDDPDRFADFLTEAAQHDPDPAFQQAAATVTVALSIRAKEHVRQGNDLDWHHAWGLTRLAHAARDVGGHADTAGTELGGLAMSAQFGAARAYVAGVDAGLFADPGPDTYRLSMTHRDANAEIMDRTWQAVWDAIELCPDNPGGRELRRVLIVQARAHLTVARADFASLYGDSAQLISQRDELATHIATLYAQLDIQFSAIAEAPQVSFGDEGPISLN